jgi:hypothetical protein
VKPPLGDANPYDPAAMRRRRHATMPRYHVRSSPVQHVAASATRLEQRAPMRDLRSQPRAGVLECHLRSIASRARALQPAPSPEKDCGSQLNGPKCDGAKLTKLGSVGQKVRRNAGSYSHLSPPD